MVLPDATVHEYWQGRLVSVRFALGTADGRAAGTLARTIQVPSVSSIWIPVRRRVPAPRVIERTGPGRRPCPGTPRRSWPRQSRASERKRMRLPGASVFLFPHHAERRGRSGRTRALPPIWGHSWVGWLTVPAEPERAFCCIARAIFARGRDLRLGDQRCLRSLAACLCRVRQPGRAHRVQLGDLGEHGLQAYVAGNRLDQRQRLRLPVVGLVIAGGRGRLREPRWRPGRAALSPAA